ncbi:MAG: TonB-dependent receptor domain-containing protein [Bacteroidales bacterium]
MRRYSLFLFMVIVLISMKGVYSQVNSFRVDGIVLDKNKRGIPYATIYCKELQRGIFSDEKGRFDLGLIPYGKYELNIQCLGYQTCDTSIIINSNRALFPVLDIKSLQLKELEVIAHESKQGHLSSKIDRTAMKHIQPSSFTDLLSLLPGHTAKTPDLSSVNSIKIRQVGSDYNSFLGTAFVVDDTPLSNDVNLQTFSNGHGDLKIRNRKIAGGGIDMREISTNEIESVEIIRGIAPVQYGEATSGLVLIKQKHGKTPYAGRIKTDYKTKLIALSKGFALPNKLGTLNVGFDYLNFYSDPRNIFEKYNRVTSSLRYRTNFPVLGKMFLLRTNLSFTGTLDSEKEDPELNYGINDSYRSSYSKYLLSLHGKWLIEGKNWKKIDFRISGNLSVDRLTRNRIVFLNGPISLPVSKVEGEFDGIYLSSEYPSSLLVEGKPFYLTGQLISTWEFKQSEFKQKIIVGGDFRFSKNYGKGEIYNPLSPPFPGGGKSTRPRAYSSIPSLQKLSFFIQNRVAAKLFKNQLDVRVGVRFNSMLNLVQKHYISKRIFLDPRVNVTYNLFTTKMFDKTFSCEVHMGFGYMTKLPVITHLYPTRSYYDIMQLNYYSQDPQKRRLFIKTLIKDRTNYNLKPARNLKKEIGLRFNWGKTIWNVNYFHENLSSGFKYQSKYFSVQYKDYNESSKLPSDIDGPPDLDLFDYKLKNKLFAYSEVQNASRTIKEGIEFHVNVGKLNVINTNLSINGAWFRTMYDNSIPVTYKPSIILQDREYPYVGIYDVDTKEFKERLNTNFRLDTHIPELRILFSTSIEIVWFRISDYVENSGIPSSYLDEFGNKYLFTESSKDDQMLSLLIRKYNKNFFNSDKIPLALNLNLKVTKELGRSLSFSFFVDRVMDYYPVYTSKFGKKVKRIVYPYFGAEINFKL